MTGTFVLRCAVAPSFRIVMSPKGVLGRSERCDYVVDDRSVSRTHAQITIQDCGLHVVDLESRNGTFVDSRRVATADVAEGQIIRFGAVPFAVLREGTQYPFEEETGRQEEQEYAKDNLIVQAKARLTEAQGKVLDYLLTGIAEKSIASELSLSPHTIHNHVREIFRKLDVHSRAQLSARFRANSPLGLD